MSYRFYSYWSPQSSSDSNDLKASQILKQINVQLNIPSLDSLFFNDLSSGSYTWGMSTVQVNRFCDDGKKSGTLYQYVEQRLKKEFSIHKQTDPLEFPSIFIDDKESDMCHLNDYEYSQVKEITIYPEGPAASAIYGVRGKSDVIDVKLKPTKRHRHNHISGK